jgi:hypothetical protein
MNTTQLFNIKRASLHLSAVQSEIEEHPSIYSEKTWGLVADLLLYIDKLEESITFEENTHPAER